jgi:hypothetical protein
MTHEHKYTDEQLKGYIDTLVALARLQETGSAEDEALLAAARILKAQMQQPGDVTIIK